MNEPSTVRTEQTSDFGWLSGPPERIYRRLLAAAVVVWGYWLAWRGVSMPWAVLLPSVTLLAAFLGLHRLTLAVPALLFAVMIAEGSLTVTAPDRLFTWASPLAMLSLAVIALAARWRTQAEGIFPRQALISTWNRRDVPAGPASRDPARDGAFHARELVSLLLIPLAWCVAVQVVGGLRANLAPAEPEYGLLPPTYFAVKLTFVLGLLLLACRGLLAYAGTCRGGGTRGSLALRLEIWKWNGREQRLFTLGRKRFWRR